MCIFLINVFTPIGRFSSDISGHCNCDVQRFLPHTITVYNRYAGTNDRVEVHVGCSVVSTPPPFDEWPPRLKSCVLAAARRAIDLGYAIDYAERK